MKKPKFKALKSKTLLLVEVKHCWIKVSVIQKNAQDCKIIASTDSLSLNPLQAVEEAIAQFRKNKVKVPKKAILLTTESLPSFLEVPIDESLPAAQVEEILQWEMEEHLENFTTPPSRIALLSHPDFLPAELRQRLRAMQEKALALGEDQPTRSMIIDQQIISEEDFDAVEDFMLAWPNVEEAANCSWRQDYCETPKLGTCLTSFMSIPRRDIWLDLFQSLHIQLEFIFPWHLSSLALVPLQPIKNSSYALIENSLGLINCIYFEKGQISEMQSYTWDEQELPKALVDDLDFHEVTAISAMGLEDGFERLKTAQQENSGKTHLNKEISLHQEKASLYPSFAAAQVAWGMTSDFKVPILTTAKASLPLRQRASTYWLAYLVLWASLISYLFYGKYRQLEALKKDHALLEKSNVKKGEELSAARKNNQEYDELLKKKQSLEAGPQIVTLAKTNKALNNEKILQSMKAIFKHSNQYISFSQLTLIPQESLSIEGRFKSPVAFYRFLAAFSQDSNDAGQIIDQQLVNENYDSKTKQHNFDAKFKYKK